MTTTDSRQGALETAVPLSPLQRTLLAHDQRSLAWTVSVPLDAAELLGRVTATLPAFSPLTCALVDVPGLRIPRQRQEPADVTTHDDGSWRVVAGVTSLEGRPDGRGTTLIVRTDPLFVDGVTLANLLTALADPDASRDFADFLAVAAGHQAMLDAGELVEEAAFWQAQRRTRQDDADVLARLGLRRAGGSTAEPLTAAVGVTAAAGSDLSVEVAHLALGVLVARLAPDSSGPARVVDVRELMGLPGTPGMFHQVLPDVLDVDGSRTVRELLDRQRARHEQQDAWAGGPALAPGDVVPGLVLDARPSWSLPAGWRLLEASETRSGVLLLRAEVGDDGLHVTASSGADLDPHAVRAFLSAWAHLIEQLAADDGRVADTAALLTDEEPVHVTASSDVDDQDGDLCRRFDAFVADAADAPAVLQGSRTVTRGELKGLVGAVLERLGDIGPGTVVGVLAVPSPELVAVMLATLWRGAAFLPLDPAEPTYRVVEALRRAGAGYLVVGDDVPTVTPPDGCVLVPVPSEGAHVPGPPADVPSTSTAYVMRTSGSTGRPKLVPIRRSSLDNHLRWVADELVRDGEVLPVVSSPTFDASLKQLLGPLWAGRPVLLLEADRADVEAVCAELAGVPGDHELVLNCVPSYWREVLEVPRSAGPLRLRRLLLGGEPVSDALLTRTAEAYPGVEIWNLYGPTEATVTATAGRLTPGEPVHAGFPVAGATLSVVDRAAHAVPAGLPGEVWLHGPGLSPGYLDPAPGELAAFVPRDGGAPVYRTGDLGWVDAEGRLHLLGRRDDQVKLRGWRIELGEIEKAAETHPAVDRAVAVLVGSDEDARLRLFTTGDATGTEVRDWLTGWLPAAMVPGSVTAVGRLPVTAAGKVDRRELADSIPERAEVSPDDYSDAERVVATAWRAVLSGPWPHVDDEFFAAGGHSLLLARLVNQLRAQGHTELSLRQVVRNPTVASIAALLTSVSGS